MGWIGSVPGNPLHAGVRDSLERQVAEALEVQARFLPDSLGRSTTLECAGLSLPACGVGGDFYDFLKASPRRLALALADVSGHGLPAALLLASLQACLRIHFAHGGGDLAGCLRSVNRFLLEWTAAEHFATLFLAEHDDRTGGLRYVNCGHPPALLLRADGRSERLGSTAPLLGVLDEWRCSIGETTLDTDDTLILYSDGVTEAVNPASEPFGERRLEAVARDMRRLPVGRLVRTLADRVLVFAGGSLADDLTVVVARPRIPASLERRTAEVDRRRRTSSRGG